ncbi:hypothetical protein, partial [[Clostridium] innocuum]
VNDNEEHRKYYIKVNSEYVEVSEEVFKTIRSSYDQMRYIHHMEVAKSVLYFEDIDLATFFVSKNETELIDKIVVHDLYMKVLNEISLLNEPNRTIANLIFIENKSIRDVAKILGVKNSTIIYHKKQLQKIIQKKLKKFLPLDE